MWTQDRPGSSALPGASALDKCQDEPCSWDLVRRKGLQSLPDNKANLSGSTVQIYTFQILNQIESVKKVNKKTMCF